MQKDALYALAIALPVTTHLDGFKPARLLDLVVDDRLVLVKPLVSGPREDDVLERGGKRDVMVRPTLRAVPRHRQTVYTSCVTSQHIYM